MPPRSPPKNKISPRGGSSSYSSSSNTTDDDQSSFWQEPYFVSSTAVCQQGVKIKTITLSDRGNMIAIATNMGGIEVYDIIDSSSSSESNSTSSKSKKSSSSAASSSSSQKNENLDDVDVDPLKYFPVTINSTTTMSNNSIFKRKIFSNAARLQGHDRGVAALQFCCDDRALCSSGSGDYVSVFLHSLETGKPIKKFDEDEGAVAFCYLKNLKHHFLILVTWYTFRVYDCSRWDSLFETRVTNKQQQQPNTSSKNNNNPFQSIYVGSNSSAHASLKSFCSTQTFDNKYFAIAMFQQNSHTPNRHLAAGNHQPGFRIQMFDACSDWQMMLTGNSSSTLFQVCQTFIVPEYHSNNENNKFSHNCEEIQQIQFSKDSRFLVANCCGTQKSNKREILVWKVDSGALKYRFLGSEFHFGQVSSICLLTQNHFLRSSRSTKNYNNNQNDNEEDDDDDEQEQDYYDDSVVDGSTQDCIIVAADNTPQIMFLSTEKKSEVFHSLIPQNSQIDQGTAEKKDDEKEEEHQRTKSKKNNQNQKQLELRTEFLQQNPISQIITSKNESVIFVAAGSSIIIAKNPIIESRWLQRRSVYLSREQTNMTKPFTKLFQIYRVCQRVTSFL